MEWKYLSSPSFSKGSSHNTPYKSHHLFGGMQPSGAISGIYGYNLDSDITKMLTSGPL